MRNPRAAALAIRKAAQEGSAAAQVIYGQLLLNERSVACDPDAALLWFERAAAQGDAEGWNMAGRCHEKGWGIPSDYSRAAVHFEEAARRGHLWGKVNLAQILMRLGDPGDRPRAFALFKEAADRGHLKAMNSLARCYEEGWGTAPDPRRAVDTYKQAAARGDHWAQFNMATLLMHAGEAHAARLLVRQALLRSDDGFRRRVAALLVESDDEVLREIGYAALSLCDARANTPDLVPDAQERLRHARKQRGPAGFPHVGCKSTAGATRHTG
ncbi:tetratricopeptide repeat protein [Sphingobium sp. HWE2-09]|uniref:tetratricopeptide repeat protein n=1 Tax=Sphingobium sp. HWE2-09 TaxID=3108390 RepID=UPI002DC2DB49|nr:tetratricopeptide repeat protein [Sphingobium sp. HWE2-09]